MRHIIKGALSVKDLRTGNLTTIGGSVLQVNVIGSGKVDYYTILTEKYINDIVGKYRNHG